MTVVQIGQIHQQMQTSLKCLKANQSPHMSVVLFFSGLQGVGIVTGNDLV